MNDNIDEDDEQMNITDEMSSGLRLPRSHGVTLDQKLVTHGGQVSVLTCLEIGYYHIMYQWSVSCCFDSIFDKLTFTNINKKNPDK